MKKGPLHRDEMPKGSSSELEERPAREAPLSACGNCGRKFASDRLDLHFNICVNQRETKPFNIAEKRIEGTEAEELLKTGESVLQCIWCVCVHGQ